MAVLHESLSLVGTGAATMEEREVFSVDKKDPYTLIFFKFQARRFVTTRIRPFSNMLFSFMWICVVIGRTRSACVHVKGATKTEKNYESCQTHGPTTNVGRRPRTGPKRNLSSIGVICIVIVMCVLMGMRAHLRGSSCPFMAAESPKRTHLNGSGARLCPDQLVVKAQVKARPPSAALRRPNLYMVVELDLATSDSLCSGALGHPDLFMVAVMGMETPDMSQSWKHAATMQQGYPKLTDNVVFNNFYVNFTSWLNFVRCRFRPVHIVDGVVDCLVEQGGVWWIKEAQRGNAEDKTNSKSKVTSKSKVVVSNQIVRFKVKFKVEQRSIVGASKVQVAFSSQHSKFNIVAWYGEYAKFTNKLYEIFTMLFESANTYYIKSYQCLWKACLPKSYEKRCSQRPIAASRIRTGRKHSWPRMFRSRARIAHLQKAP